MKARREKHYFLSELWGALPLAMVALAVGIFWVIISFTTGCEAPASGAVLVCAAIVAEVLLRKSVWMHAANIAGLNSLEYTTISNSSQQRAFHIVKSHTYKNSSNDKYFNPKIFSVLEKLYRNAKAREVMKSGSWQFYATANRINNNISWLIIGASLSGTGIWGYAHLFEDECCRCFLGC